MSIDKLSASKNEIQQKSNHNVINNLFSGGGLWSVFKVPGDDEVVVRARVEASSHSLDSTDSGSPSRSFSVWFQVDIIWNLKNIYKIGEYIYIYIMTDIQIKL